MAKIKFIKDLSAGENTLLRLLGTFVFGDKKIEPYDETKVYNYGNLIVYHNPITNNIEIMQCAEDNVTGAFDISVWETASVADTAISSGSKMITINSTQPTDKGNILWLKPIKERTLEIPATLM